MNDKEWDCLKKTYYRSPYVCMTDEGTIDFSIDDFNALETNGHHITYDEYLDIMRKSGDSGRQYFMTCFYDACSAIYTGEIQKFSKKRDKLLFGRVLISGIRYDGTMFTGKEDHVWMDIAGFEGFSVGDDIEFTADVYRYLKTGHGKQIDYAIRNPTCIEKTGKYALPSDDELLSQDIDRLICEDCLYGPSCCYAFCMDERWRNAMRHKLKKLSELLDRLDVLTVDDDVLRDPNDIEEIGNYALQTAKGKERQTVDDDNDDIMDYDMDYDAFSYMEELS